MPFDCDSCGEEVSYSEKTFTLRNGAEIVICKKCGTRVDDDTIKNHRDHDIVSSFAFQVPKTVLIDWSKEKVAQCGNCGAVGDPLDIRNHFADCMARYNKLNANIILSDGKDCQHNWTYYDPTPGRINAVLYPHGAPVYQICVTCYKKRVGHPQPIRWEEVTND